MVLARVNGMVGAAWGVPGQVKRDSPEFQVVLGLLCTFYRLQLILSYFVLAAAVGHHAASLGSNCSTFGIGIVVGLLQRPQETV